MASILVGIDGSERGDSALSWAIERAHIDGADLELVTVLDARTLRAAGGNEDVARTAAETVLEGARQKALNRYPSVNVSFSVIKGKVVDAIVDAAAGHSLVVLGSHHGASVSESIGGAKGLRVSVSSNVPTVVVPVDWDAIAPHGGITVGVGPDDTCDNAVAFGVAEASKEGKELKLVSAWGLPPLLARPAAAMGGEFGRVGEQFQAGLDARVKAIKAEHADLDVKGTAIEGASPTRVLLEASRGDSMLVLGTHTRTVLGRALFGSIPHSVLGNLAVPTVMVPATL